MKKNNLSRKSPVVAVDGVIIEKGKILLVKRKVYPFSGYCCLPGGHVEYGEKTEQAIKREMKEELGISVKIKKIIGVYSNPKRDPRGHSVSIAYLLGITSKKKNISLNYEASEFKFFSLKNLPQKIGFDHRQIINDAKKIK